MKLNVVPENEKSVLKHLFDRSLSGTLRFEFLCQLVCKSSKMQLMRETAISFESYNDKTPNMLSRQCSTLFK